MLLLKKVMSDLKVSIDIITSIAGPGLTAILVIMSVSTFKIDVFSICMFLCQKLTFSYLYFQLKSREMA